MGTNKELYNVAKKHIGEGGSKFRKYCGLSSGSAYCNAYVCYVANEGGVKSLFFDGTKQTYCPTSIKWCRSNLAEIPLYLAMPMDIIYFDWEKNGVPNHIGFVKARKDTSSIFTHEGNTNNSVVAEKTRTVGYVQGIYRPHFKGTYDISKPLVVDGQFEYSSIAMLQVALGIKVDAILGKDTVKALQKKAGVTPDGAWGKDTSKAVQKMVGVKVDGAFGVDSVKGLQKWINKNVQFKTDGTKTETVKKEETPTPTPQPPSPSKYGGEFPDWVALSGNIIAQTARELAWAKGTNKAKYTYPNGKATALFTKAINKVYPNRSSWSAQCRAGASCDVGAGTILRYSGAFPTISRALEKQIPQMEQSKAFKDTGIKKSANAKAGDVGIFANKGKGAHIWINMGGNLVAEANHGSKQCFHLKAKTINNSTSRKKYYCFRMTTPIRKYIKNGDIGSEVTKLQKFLKWAGFDCGTVDGEFGERTLGAVKNFQLKVGLTADGEFGSKSLAKAKEYTK